VGSKSRSKSAESVGINYTFANNFAVYAQWELGMQMDAGGSNPSNAPISVTLYEAGVRYSGYGVIGSVVLFETGSQQQQRRMLRSSFPTDNCQLA